MAAPRISRYRHHPIKIALGNRLAFDKTKGHAEPDH